MVPYYPKEPLLYPHFRNFMRFSDSTHFLVQKPNEYENSDSSLFNSDESDESPSDENSSHNDSTSHSLRPTTSNYDSTNLFSNDSSPNKIHDNPPFKNLIKTHQTGPIDKSRHPSHNQSNLPQPPIDRTTKIQYNLRHQPKMDSRLFIQTSKL